MQNNSLMHTYFNDKKSPTLVLYRHIYPNKALPYFLIFRAFGLGWLENQIENF